MTSRYFIAPAFIGLGVAVGLLIFLFAYPGKPKIGVIDVPFTVISEDSAYVISQYLEYARRDDSIKAVVIKITSPGGGAAASERLYLETKKLREDKPVVMVMNGLVASGGYMMAMGVSHSYAQTSSLVGNVGVVSFSDPLVPPLPGGAVVSTGPYKISGFTRDEWFGMIEELKDSFAQIVISERSEQLRLSRDELTQGRLYSGLRSVQLGLVDELGGDSDAFDKAADLAGISSYGQVDVNLEVLRQFIKDLEGILPSSSDNGGSAETMTLIGRDYTSDGPELQSLNAEPGSSMERLAALQGLTLYGRLGVSQEDPLPEFPLELNHPHFYYLYVGDAR